MKKPLLEAYENLEEQLSQLTEKLGQSSERLQQEIGDRQKSPGLLKQNEIFLHSIFDTITDGMIIIDPDFYILRANLAMANIWGTNTPWRNNSVLVFGKDVHRPVLGAPLPPP